MLTTLLAAPASEPVALADMRAFLRQDATDEDALIGLLITAARLQVESLTGRALIEQSWRVEARADTGAIALPIGPARQLLAAPAGAVLKGEVVQLPAVAGTVTMDYVAGAPSAADVPADLRQAVMALVAYWYENRDLATAPPAAVERTLLAYRQVRL